MKRAAAVLIVGVFAAAPTSLDEARAASASTSFNTSVVVNRACTVAATDMDFGTFTGSIPANRTATSTATVSCNRGTAYALSFTVGAGPANATGTVTVNMANGTNPTIPANLTMSRATRTAGAGSASFTINGRIVNAVTQPAIGTYTVTRAIYVLY